MTKKSFATRQFASYPTEIEIITASAEAKEGRWSAIQVIKADFPDNDTNFIQNGVGKNLSPLNDVLPDGSGLMVLGFWEKLHIPLGSDAVIIAYLY